MSSIDQIKGFVFGLGYEAGNDEIADAVLDVEATLARLEKALADLLDAVENRVPGDDALIELAVGDARVALKR